MRRVALLIAAVSSVGLAGCHATTTTHALAEGVTASPKPADSQVDILQGRPSRPFRSIGTVEVRVDRGNALHNPTLADALPALSAEARRMGADAVILTHEEFTSWFDKGEDASPIHDLERQESWYITEKARYVSGVAVQYTGPACAPPSPTRGPVTYAPVSPSRPVYVVPPASPTFVPMTPAPMPPPSDGSMPVAPTSPSLPEGPIDLPPPGGTGGTSCGGGGKCG